MEEFTDQAGSISTASDLNSKDALKFTFNLQTP
jgi:hypothetical protein